MKHTEWPVPEPRTNADTAWALVTRFMHGRLLETVAGGGVRRYEEQSETYAGTVELDEDGAVCYIDWEQVAALRADGAWAYLSSSERAVLDLAIRLGTGPDLWMLDRGNSAAVADAIADGLARSFTR